MEGERIPKIVQNRRLNMLLKTRGRVLVRRDEIDHEKRGKRHSVKAKKVVLSAKSDAQKRGRGGMARKKKRRIRRGESPKSSNSEHRLVWREFPGLTLKTGDEVPTHQHREATFMKPNIGLERTVISK